MQKTQSEKAAVQLAHIELWEEYWKNPDSGEALSRLVEVLLPLVRRVLERISITLPSHVATEDLMQAALIGLYYAINRFDPKQGYRFEAFAYPRVRGAILDELRSMDHVSRSCRFQLKRIEKFIRQWMHDYRENPTEQQIAAGMGIELAELLSTLDRAQPWLSLDEVILHGDGGGTTLREHLADTQAASPDEEAQKEDLRGQLRKMFMQLTPREQKILYLYYFEELRLSEIAVLYNLTEARICQIHAFALAKLRASLGCLEGECSDVRRDY